MTDVEPAAPEKSADGSARDGSARDRSARGAGARENARERAPGGATAPLAFWTPALLLLAGLAVYAGGLWLHTGEILPQSRWPYFAYYAQALLDGQLHFSQLPPARLDLSEFDGRLYMHFPPFPAVLLAPFVAVFGVEIADRLLCATLGAVNGVSFYFLLGALDREALIQVSERARIFLSLFFLFGTVHFYLAITSNPWELAHVVCNALVIVALALTLRRRMVLTALALAAILFTRTHVFLVAPVLAGIFWRLEARDGSDAATRIRQLLPFAAIGCAAVSALLVFNEARFGDPFENGVRYHAMHESFRERYSRLGYFDVAYLGQNLHALLLRLPAPSSGFPWLSFQTEGLSLFLASPLYLYLFASLRRPTRSLATLLWGGIVLASVPILLLMGTGENQFGHRYSSDLQVFLILLTFLGMGMQVTRTSLALLGASILMNAWGAWWFVSHYAQ